jgi:hypothetical protein
MLGSAWRESRRAARVFARSPGTENMRYMAQCVEIGVIICMIEAMALSLGTNKILWMMLAWCATLGRLATRQANVLQPAPEAAVPAADQRTNTA